MKVARDGHGGGVENWLATLLAQAAQSDWPHLDLLIDQANLPPRWQKKLPQALTLQQMLLQGTAHAEAADEAALLCRYQLGDERARTRLLACLGELDGATRVMVLFSHWPFDDLVAHLRHFLLAEWQDGTQKGVLRYYNPALFGPVLAALPPVEAERLLSAAAEWHWIDRDGQCWMQHGTHGYTVPYEVLVQPLQLDDAAVSQLSAWHQAELYVQDNLLTPRQCRCPTKEAMMQKLFTLQMTADEKQLWSQPERTAFISQNL